MSLQIICSVEESVPQLRQRKDWKTAFMLLTQHKWLLYLSSPNVISYFCKRRLSSSRIMFPPSISKSYNKKMKVSRASTTEILFKWTSWIWLRLSPTVLLTNEMEILEVFSSGCWVAWFWRASAQKWHKSSIYGCLVFSFKMRHSIVTFLNRVSAKTASLQPRGTSWSRTARMVIFVNF